MTERRDPRIREAAARLAMASPPAPTFDELTHVQTSPHASRVPAWAIAVAAAAAVLVVIGGTSMLLGGSDGSTEPSPAAQSATAAPVPATVLGASGLTESWNPALTDTVARVPPIAATCPSGTTPNVRGSNPELRPAISSGNPSNQAAAFDTRLGRIVLLDRFGETWVFDVCTNSWIEMHADVDGWFLPTERRFDDDGSLATYSGDLVYDNDSDRTIAFGNLGYYDSDSNAWHSLSSKG